jgi:hypothetical protein
MRAERAFPRARPNESAKESTLITLENRRLYCPGQHRPIGRAKCLHVVHLHYHPARAEHRSNIAVYAADSQLPGRHVHRDTRIGWDEKIASETSSSLDFVPTSH